MFDNFQGQIVVATKRFNVKELNHLYSLGYKNFGVQTSKELILLKKSFYGYDIRWHFIGNLQSNKVKDVINEIEYLHSLSRLSQISEINKHLKNTLKVFIQVNTSNESAKNGIFPHQLPNFIQECQKIDKIKVIGLMTVGNQDCTLSEKCFSLLNELAKMQQLSELSMGMSGDYLNAIKYGATYIRLGTILRSKLNGNSE